MGDGFYRTLSLLCDETSILYIFVLNIQNGDSALMMAAREGKSEVTKLLLKAGANMDIQNEV